MMRLQLKTLALACLLPSLSACVPNSIVGRSSGILGAARKGNAAAMRTILDAGGNVDYKDLWTNTTALMAASEAGNVDIVKLLLAEGADINARNLSGRTSLMLAAERGQSQVAKLLIERGANVLSTDNGDMTPLKLAAKRGDSETVRVIRTAEAKAKQESEVSVEWHPGGSMAPVAVAAKAVPETRVAPSFYSDVDKPRFQSSENPKNFALVIGIEKYANVPDADYSERDAAAVREHLKGLGYPERNILYLAGQQASRSGFEKYLESWLPRNVDQESRVFFYFSGHGAPDTKSGTAYLLPWDGDAKFLENTAYPVNRLYQKLSALPAKEIIVAIDACFSGAGGRSVIPKGARPLVTSVVAVDTGRAVVLAAAAGDEITGADAVQGHGLFTYFLLKGLNESKGGLTAKQLYEYILPRVRDAARRENRDQTPQLIVAQDYPERASILIKSR